MRWEGGFLSPFTLKAIEMAYPALADNHAVFILRMHPLTPPTVPPFLIMQNLPPNDFTGYDIVKSSDTYVSLVGNG